MRAAVTLVCLGLVVTACAATRESPPSGAAKLYEAVAASGSPSISVIDARSHAVDRRLPLGAPSSDWNHLYSIVSTSLLDTDPETGSTLRTLSLGDTYQLPAATASGVPGGLSANGWWLVVQSYDGTATHLLVVDTEAFKMSHRVSLTGRFVFDAISDDGQRLYLIQYLNGKEYYVRQYNINVSRLDANIVVDKSDGNQAMTGLRLSGVPARDGSVLFSMYVRENDVPFIHALNLSGPFAFCLDLPGDGYAQNKAGMHWALAMRNDGSRLYAINAATGIVAEIDPTNQYSPQTLRTSHIGGGTTGANGPGVAVISRDGKTLVGAGSTGLVWVDTTNLSMRMSTMFGWHVSALGLSSDGETLYAVSDQGRIAEVSMKTAAIVAEFDSAQGKPIALMRVAAA